MKYYLKVLPKDVLKSLDRLKQVSSINDFYLAGGTALALQLGHRPSIDLDFFSAVSDLGFDDRSTLVQDLHQHAQFVVVEEKDGTLHGRVGKTAISFFKYSYPFVRPLKKWDEIWIASIEDIGLMKLGALIGRGAKKDFIDLYFILQKVAMNALIKMSRKKFKGVEDFALQVLKALVFFQDAEKERMPLVHREVSWEVIKLFFEKQARSLSGTPSKHS